MKRTIALMLVLCLVVASASVAFAAERKRRGISIFNRKVDTGQSKADIMQMQGNAVTALNARVWTVNLTPKKGSRGKAMTDVLTFKGGTVISEYLTGLEYGPSNYAVNIQPDGLPVIETMQRTEDNDLAAFRMELAGTLLRGTLSIIPKNGRVEKYIFKSVD